MRLKNTLRFNSTNGRIITVNLEHAAKSKRPKRASSFQEHVRRVLATIFQGVTFYEDFYVDGLYLDFYSPSMSIAIEVDGSQHDKFHPFFHKNGSRFSKHIQRDGRKEEFCQINDITLVRIPEKDAFNEARILQRIEHELEQ